MLPITIGLLSIVRSDSAHLLIACSNMAGSSVAEIEIDHEVGMTGQELCISIANQMGKSIDGLGVVLPNGRRIEEADYGRSVAVPFELE